MISDAAETISTSSEVHVLGRVDDPESVADRIVENAKPGAVIIDLSAGQLNSPHRPHRHIDEERLAQITWINGQHFAPEIGDISRNAYIKWLSEAADQPIAHGKSIKEWFTYKGEISLWWFTDISLKHPTYQPQRWSFYQIFALQHIVASEDTLPKSWKIWSSRAEFSVLQQVPPNEISINWGQYKDSKTDKSSDHNNIREVLERYRLGKTVLLIREAFQVSRQTLADLQQLSQKTKKLRDSEESTSAQEHVFNDEKKPLVLCRTGFPNSWTRVPESLNLRTSSEWYDRYLGDLPAQLQDEGYNVAWLTSVKPDSEKSKKWSLVRETQTVSDATPWMVLTNKDARSIAWHQLKWAFLYIYLFVWCAPTVEWKYRDIALGHWIRETYRWAWRNRVKALVDIERYKYACQALNPAVVVYRNEFYPEGRRISAALKGKTHLVGLQHGLISREHTVYQWDPNDIQEIDSRDQPDHVNYVPSPDWFAAFGDKYVEEFAHWDGYPAERVIATGSVRHDVLVDQFRLNAKKENRKKQTDLLRRRYSLPVDKPVILLCTRTQQDAEVWFEMVVSAVRKNEIDVFIAVKLHQYHGGGDLVHRVAQKNMFNEYQVYEEGLYSLMNASDVLVTSASTTMLEGSLFGLKGIEVVATKQYQVSTYSDSDVATAVESPQEMGIALLSLLQSEIKISTSNNLSRYLRNKDGSALNRLSALLKEVMSKRKKVRRRQNSSV